MFTKSELRLIKYAVNETMINEKSDNITYDLIELIEKINRIEKEGD